MTSLSVADILDLVAYEKSRPEIRLSAMAARRLRRVQVGPMVTLSFESLETVKYQIQEMIRAERIVDEGAIQAEIDVYSDLLPGPDSLASTLFIEIEDTQKLREWLPRLVGVEHAVSMEIEGAGRSSAKGEEGRSKEDVTSTVHYLRFTFDPAQVDAMRSGARCVLSVDHENYGHSIVCSEQFVAALASDIEAAGG